MKILLLSLVIALSPLFALDVSAQDGSVLIRNASIIDGSGRRMFRGSVRIEKGSITGVGNLRARRGETVIDAKGKVLAPGFIDIHNHSEFGLLTEGTAMTQVSQGITTIFVGPDGGSPYPIGEYLAKIEKKTAPNVLAFIGHGDVRQQVMGEDLRRQATDKEVASMVAIVEQAMKEGAVGFSTGLEYDAGFSASTEEVIALAKAAAKHGGIYMTHMRDEEDGMLDSLREAIRIGREAKIPVQISHIKMGNRNVWKKSGEAIRLIEEAKRSGLDITADVYPYTAWASTITVLVPSRKHDDRAEIEKGLFNVGGADKVLVTSCAAFPAYEFKNLAEIAEMEKTTPADIYMKIVKAGGAGVVGNSMNESDVENFIKHPLIMVSSDGGINGRHPRGAGTFPRVLGRYVRNQKLISLEEAVRKMTSLPAKRTKLMNKGLIRKGMDADLVLFDRDKVIDNSTFQSPQLIATGVESVWVGGVLVWDGTKVTGNLPGQVFRKNSRR